MNPSKSNAPLDVQGQFPQTAWPIVLQAGDDSTTVALPAFERLCHAYCPPLRGWLLRHGISVHEVDDFIQSFFMTVTAKHTLRYAKQGKGRFRTFLLTALKMHMINVHRKASALKRGGGQALFSLDETDAEGEPLLDPPCANTPDIEFDRDWALNVLGRVIHRLESEYDAEGRGKLFRHLQACLYGDNDALKHSEAALALEMTAEAIRAACCRLRLKYQHLIRQEIRETVAGNQDVADELAVLFEALSVRR